MNTFSPFASALCSSLASHFSWSPGSAHVYASQLKTFHERSRLFRPPDRFRCLTHKLKLYWNMPLRLIALSPGLIRVE